MLKSVEIARPGHPDKVCDQIADALVDEFLRRDPKSTVDLQVLGGHGMVMVAGTVDSKADFDAAKIVLQVYKEIGYKDEIEPFIHLERPSEDLSRVLVRGGTRGTTIAYGYASRETREFLPRALVYARAITRRLDDLREQDPQFNWLGPDGKVQVTMQGQKTVAVSLLAQHDVGVEPHHVQSQLLDSVVTPIIGQQEGVKIFVNSGGPFTLGGFEMGVGSSGRKILSDTYGGLLPSTDFGLSGKDPSQPPRAGSYMARFIAKQLVREEVAGNVFVKIGYTIGQVDPVFVEAVTGKGQDLSDLVKGRFDLRIESIVEFLKLRQPFYRRATQYGQFGHDGFPWEDPREEETVDISTEI
jgi:S-adenosylmethionine synthetase